MRYSIWEGNMESLMKKVTRIQNKCKKYGCDFHFEEVGEEFKTYEEAKNYVKNLIKGTASTYKKTQKEARALLELTIEEVEYK